MKKSLTAVAALSLAFGVVAPAFARHQVCEDVETKQIQSKDNNRLIGTGVGAVAGGVLGHQVGGGKGKTLATVGGAVAGGYVGNQVQKNHQDKNATYSTERRCHWVDD
ncbi:glycine zipper 2TM domain-containing protein [Bacillus sp. NP157]|nr:glycine zipper 2TM domain-containing protein [Bacillus sp. NP157]